jgi:hypothetical protein
MRIALCLCLFIVFAISDMHAQPVSFSPIWDATFLELGGDFTCNVFPFGDSLLLVGTHVTEDQLNSPMLMWVTNNGQFLDTIVVHTDVSHDYTWDCFLSAHQTLIFCGYDIETTDSVISFAEEVTLDGQLVWYTPLRFSNSRQQELYSGCRAANGDYIFAGYTVVPQPRNTSYNYWWVRCDSLGTVLAQDTVAQRGNELDYMLAYAVAPTLDNGFVIGGDEWTYHPLLVKIDAFGQTVWRQRAGAVTGPNTIQAIKVLDNGDFIVAGKTLEQDTPHNDVFISRHDAMGNQIWITIPHESWNQETMRIIQDSDERLFLISRSFNQNGLFNLFLVSVDGIGRCRAVTRPITNLDIHVTSGCMLPDCSIVVAGSGSYDYGTGIYPTLYCAARYGPDRSVPSVPQEFDLLSPSDSSEVTSHTVEFAWMPSVDTDPYDTVRYQLKVWTAGDSLVLPNILDSRITVQAADLERLHGEAGYAWQVFAHSQLPDTMIPSRDVHHFMLHPSAVESSTGSVAACFKVGISPNPFNASTTISYFLPKPSFATMRVFDVSGREVMALGNGMKEAGDHSAVFEGSNLGSGIYFVRIEAGPIFHTAKMVLLK